MENIPNNQEEFGRLFKAHYPAMVLLARKYVEDTDTARDLAQQVFVNMYEKRAKLTIKTSVKSYLFQAVRNASLNWLNQRKTKAKHEDRILQNTNTSENSDPLEVKELGKLLAGLIEELPPQCRRIFKMNRYEGKRNREIAAELNISIRTVETQISKALKQLRSKIPKELIGLILFFLSQT